MQPKTARTLKLIFSYAIAAACLTWVLYNIHPRRLLQNVAHLKWQLAVLAIFAENASYVSQSVCWKLLLQPVAPVRTIKTVQATYVAMFTSNVLPMRFGEIVRAYLISKWYLKPFSEIVPSMVLEHLFEGLWLALGILWATTFIPSPKYLQRGAQVFGVGVILLAALFAYALIRKEKEIIEAEHSELGRKLIQKMTRFVDQVAIGMRRIGLSSRFFIGLGIVLFALLMQATALLLVSHAYNIPLPLWKAAVVLMIIRIGVAVPNAPANLGTYQFFAALGMELFGVDRYLANGFAVVLFIVLMAPTWITGFFALSQSGTTLFRLQHEARDAAGEDS